MSAVGRKGLLSHRAHPLGIYTHAPILIQHTALDVLPVVSMLYDTHSRPVPTCFHTPTRNTCVASCLSLLRPVGHSLTPAPQLFQLHPHPVSMSSASHAECSRLHGAWSCGQLPPSSMRSLSQAFLSSLPLFLSTHLLPDVAPATINSYGDCPMSSSPQISLRLRGYRAPQPPHLLPSTHMDFPLSADVFPQH